MVPSGALLVAWSIMDSYRFNFLPQVNLETISRDVLVVQPATGVTTVRHANGRRVVVIAGLESIRATGMESAARGWSGEIWRLTWHRQRALGFVQSRQTGQ